MSLRRWSVSVVAVLALSACDAPPQPVASAGMPQTVAVRQLVQSDRQDDP